MSVLSETMKQQSTIHCMPQMDRHTSLAIPICVVEIWKEIKGKAHGPDVIPTENEMITLLAYALLKCSLHVSISYVLQGRLFN